MKPFFQRRHLITMFIAVLALTLPLVAQGDRFEQKLAFEIDKSLPLNGVAGPVKVPTLKITNLGRGYSRGGISLRSVNQAVRSLGLIAVLGEVCCLAAAMIALPSWMLWRERVRQERTAQLPSGAPREVPGG